MKLEMTQLVIDEVTKDELVKLGIKEEWLKDIQKFRNEINEYINSDKFDEIEKNRIGDYFLTGEVYTIVDEFQPAEDKFYVAEEGLGLSIFTPREIKEFAEDNSALFEVDETYSEPQIKEIV